MTRPWSAYYLVRWAFNAHQGLINAAPRQRPLLPLRGVVPSGRLRRWVVARTTPVRVVGQQMMTKEATERALGLYHGLRHYW